MANLMTFTAYAKHRGISQPYVSQLVAKGVIPVSPGKKIDPEVADAAIERSRDVNKAHTADRHAADRAAKRGVVEDRPEVDESVCGQFNRAKAQTEKFRAKMFEINYRKAAGELCEVTAVKRAIFDTAASVRKMLERVPDRMSARIAAAYNVDARPCHLLLQGEVRDMCAELEKTAIALPENLTATRQ